MVHQGGRVAGAGWVGALTALGGSANDVRAAQGATEHVARAGVRACAGVIKPRMHDMKST